MPKRVAFVLTGLMAAVLCGAGAKADDRPVDLELVLAVDISRSMDPEEFAVQRAGYVAALRHPDFINAVRAGLNGRIALTYFEWAGGIHEASEVEWRVIDGPETANAFADALEQRAVNTFRGTSISSALHHASGRFDGSGFEAWRRVIDISGDGPNNIGPPVTQARDEALARGITINGLPILIRPSWATSDLDAYYAECVTGGPGSFVLPVKQASEFATAIRRKLILEVSGTEPEARVIPAAETPVDCLIGEKLRRSYSDPHFPELDR
jgi:hypothetical protein